MNQNFISGKLFMEISHNIRTILIEASPHKKLYKILKTCSQKSNKILLKQNFFIITYHRRISLSIYLSIILLFIAMN